MANLLRVVLRIYFTLILVTFQENKVQSVGTFTPPHHRQHVAATKVPTDIKHPAPGSHLPQHQRHDQPAGHTTAQSLVIDPARPGLTSYVRVLQPPLLLARGQSALVEYACQPGDLVAVQLYVRSEELGGGEAALRVLHRDWTCDRASGRARRQYVRMRVPAWLVYRPDALHPSAINVESLQLRAWVLDGQQRAPCVAPGDLDCFGQASVKVSYTMKTLSVYRRPRRNYDAYKCLSWDRLMTLRYVPEEEILRCAVEEEIVHLIDFPISFSGSGSGVAKEITPFHDIALNAQQQRRRIQPKFTFATTIYLMEYCLDKLCSILHRTSHQTTEYITPLLLLTKKGLIHVQTALADGSSFGVLTKFAIPLRQWVRIVYKQDGRRWSCIIHCRNGTDTIRSSNIFPRAVGYDEGEGLYFLGGSPVCPPFQGFMAAAWLWRTHAADTIPTWPPPTTLMRMVESYYKSCDRLHASMSAVYQLYLERRDWLLAEKTCPNAPLPFLMPPSSSSSPRSGPRSPTCHPWESPLLKGHKYLQSRLRLLALRNRPYMKNFARLAELLHKKATTYLTIGLSKVPFVVTLLQQASCYGNHESSYMLGTLYIGGVNLDQDLNRAYLYWLVSSQLSNRLAMMALGNHHFQGMNTLPRDTDVSFNYLKPLADLTVDDNVAHDPDGVMTEFVRLTDAKAVEVHSGEKSDHFRWLKYQAVKGIAQAQLNIPWCLMGLALVPFPC